MPSLGYDDDRGLFGLGQAPTDPFQKLEPSGNAARFLPSSIQGQYEEEDAARELRDQQIQQQYQSYVGGGNKKFVAESWDEAMTELQNIAGNVVTGYGTDLVDLGHMVGDVAAYGTGNFNDQTDEFWSDRDNPLTRWRRNKFETTTQVGQFANTTLRFLSLFVGLGWAAKGGGLIAKGAARTASKIPAAGRVVAAADKATDAIRSYGKVKAFSAADVIKAEGLTGRAVSVAKKLQDAPAYMRYDAARILNAAKQDPKAYQGLRAVGTALADNLKAFAKAPLDTQLRTAGDLVVKDAFVTFMMAEEPGMEGTIGDWAAETGNPFLLGLTSWSRSDSLDSDFMEKMKIVANDVLWSIPIQGMVEAARLANLAKTFKKVGPEAQQRIYRNLTGANYQGYVDSQLRTPLVGDPFTADVPTSPTGLPTSLPSGGPPTTSLQTLAPELLQLDSLVGQARRTADARLRVQQANANRQLAPLAAEGNPGTRTERLLPPQAASLSIPPAEIRAAVNEALKRYGASEEMFKGNFGQFKAQVEETVARLMPETRVGMGEYFKKYQPQILQDKTLQVVDNIWHSYIRDTGLEEGWVKVGNNFDYVVDTAAAARKDADVNLKVQAEQVDVELRAQEPPAQAVEDAATDAVEDTVQEQVSPSAMFREEQLRTGTAAQPPASMADEALMGAEPAAEVIRRDPAPTKDTLRKAQEVVKSLPAERTGDLRIDVTNFQLRMKTWEKALGLEPGDILDPNTTEISVEDALNLADALDEFAPTVRASQRESLTKAATQLRERVARVSGEVNDLANVGQMADDIDAIDQNGLQCDA